MPEIVPTTKNILIVAGDVSGDLHGANLIKVLKKLDPELNISALGGPKMQKVSDRFIYNLTKIGTNGFIEPLFKFILWVRIINVVRRYMEEKRPACFIAIDFYGLNHQLLGLAEHRKIPAFYYISPQVWASRPERAGRLARLIKHILVIFSFEEEIYKAEGANCTFVGHPLLDIVPEPTEKYTPPASGKWKIGLMPGSRPGEIKKHTPVFWRTFVTILKKFPKSQCYLFTTEEISDEFILSFCKPKTIVKPKIIREQNYEIRKQMDFVITCSGTATLENAILKLPMIVAYKMSFITYKIAKWLIKVPYISLVNIIANKPIVKELVQADVCSENMAGEITGMLENPEKLKEMRNKLHTIKEKLGKSGAAERAAGIIINSTFGKNE